MQKIITTARTQNNIIINGPASSKTIGGSSTLNSKENDVVGITSGNEKVAVEKLRINTVIFQNYENRIGSTRRISIQL